MRGFSTFIGVDLGGGKGKNTAVARLILDGEGIKVADYGTGKEGPWYDQRLIAYLQSHPDAVVAVDAPLTMPSCVRCLLPSCPTQEKCDVPIMSWFRERSLAPRPHANELSLAPRNGKNKPRYTPYTQRGTEVVLHEDFKILPRETLGQGMGPLASRGMYLVRALSSTHTLNDNLIEVYPKATITQLFTPRVAGRYKRSAESPKTRLDILNSLGDLSFAPGAWREDGLANDHKFDAIICAYTAYLWSRGGCVEPISQVVREDGWIWFPRRETPA
jgi:predicted nuclease with RNAse H fold